MEKQQAGKKKQRAKDSIYAGLAFVTPDNLSVIPFVNENFTASIVLAFKANTLFFSTCPRFLHRIS